MPISRNQEHYVIMTVIYDELVDFTYGEKSTFRDARDLAISISELPYEEISDYVKNTISYAINNYGKIKEVFEPHLKKWAWTRLPLLTQSILLLSYAHKQIEDIDKSIIINTAVTLAKKYCDDTQGKFINAILDEVL